MFQIFTSIYSLPYVHNSNKNMSVMIRGMLFGAMTPAIRRLPVMAYILVKL